VLQCIAGCCSLLQCVTVHCSELHMCMCMCMCMCVYMYVCLCMYAVQVIADTCESIALESILDGYVYMYVYRYIYVYVYTRVYTGAHDRSVCCASVSFCV